MKQNYRLFNWVLFLLVFVSAVSCKYNNNDDMADLTPDLFKEEVLLTTSNEIATRTSIQDNDGKTSIAWQNGDQVDIFHKNKKYSYVASIQPDGRTVVFSAVENTPKLSRVDGDTIYVLKHHNHRTISLVNGQFVADGEFGNVVYNTSNNARDVFVYSMGVINGDKLELQFEHMFSYLKVSVAKEKLKDYNYLCVYSLNQTIIPRYFCFDIKNKKFDDDIIEKGYYYAFCEKSKLDQEGDYYTTYIPVFSSYGATSYYVSGFQEGENYIGKAIMFVDDPEEGLSPGQTLKMHQSESFSHSTNYALDGSYTTMEKATKGSGIKLIFMGKGFTDKDITSGKYSKIMSRELNRFFSVEPYKSFRSYFTSYCMYRVSESNNIVSIANTDGTDENSEWETVQKYANKCINLRNELFRVILVYNGNYVGRSYTLMNTDGDFLSLIMNNSPYLTPHEAGGHGFCFLGDEYVEFDGTPTEDDIQDVKEHHDIGLYANIDYNKDQPVWQRFITNKDYKNERIGVYEGSNRYSQGMYRPTENSIMNDHSTCSTFNAPSREAIYKAIMKFSNNIYDENKFFKYDLINIPNASNEARLRTTGNNNSNAGTKQIRGLAPVIMKNRK